MFSRPSFMPAILFESMVLGSLVSGMLFEFERRRLREGSGSSFSGVSSRSMDVANAGVSGLVGGSASSPSDTTGLATFRSTSLRPVLEGGAADDGREWPTSSGVSLYTNFLGGEAWGEVGAGESCCSSSLNGRAVNCLDVRCRVRRPS